MDFLQMFLLGVGLSMDASSVSMCNGMVENQMKLKKMFFIALMFGLFQGLMPTIGYFTASMFEESLFNYIPWIALAILVFLGSKMIYEGIKHKDEVDVKVTYKGIMIQAVATSLDALTSGIIYVGKENKEALIAFSIVAIVTFVFSFLALIIGKKFGAILASKATILGGIVLILIGVKIIIEANI